MRLLSLDVGITTGYCIQDEEGKVLDIGIIEWGGRDQLRAQLRDIISDKMPTHSLIEPPVIMRGPLGDTLKEVLEAVNGTRLPPCAYVQPSQWKGTPESKLKVPVKGSLTQHERDAYRMGRWWLQNAQRSH